MGLCLNYKIKKQTVQLKGCAVYYCKNINKKWEKFQDVIEKAKRACKKSGYDIEYHFLQVGKTIKMPKNAEKTITEYELTRYACYLIAMNGDLNKDVVAQAQTYFAIQTRKQELTEQQYEMLDETEKRFYNRNITKKGNYQLNQVAHSIGVKNFDRFHEDLPTPKKSLKQLEKENKRQLKKR